jgi:hypothetical protein
VYRLSTFATLATGLALLVWAPEARACAVCATADPTLTTTGEEQPFRNRLQLSADTRIGFVEAGGVPLDDRRFEMAVAWSPLRSLEITFLAPYLFRTVTFGPTQVDYATIGDVELQAQALGYEARGAFGHRRLGIVASIKAPTAPIERDPSGAPLSAVLQPGCGGVAPTLGAYWLASRGAWSEYASASLYVPVPVRSGPHAGDSFRVSGHLQFQPIPAFAARVGVFGRIDSSGRLDDTVDDPNSGGFVGYLTGALAVAPVTDLTITAGVFLPVIEVLRGDHRESTIASLTIAYDF